MNFPRILKVAVALAALHGAALQSKAQWLTQPLALKEGWNAVYLHVDASHDTLDALVGTDVANRVEEIWMWAPNPTLAQFVTDPQAPVQASHWRNWVRITPQTATLTRLAANAAFLVRASADYTWNVKGKPVAPNYQWTTSGLNFVGFPTLPGALAPTFDTFLTPAPALKVTAEIFAYQGGPISANPAEVLDQTITKANRGQAFWIRAPEHNNYFGPFQATFTGTAGVRFGQSLGQASFRIRNTTPNDLTVTLTRVASEAPPAGQTAIQGQVPILVRGQLNTTTLTYNHTVLGSGQIQWTLEPQGQPGSEAEVVIGVDRQQLTGAPGTLHASILRLTDSLGYTQMDVGVTAETSSTAGLWIGEASVSSVSHYLNTYAKAANLVQLTNVLTTLGLGQGVNGYRYEIDPATSRILVFGGADNKTGAYLRAGATKVDQGSVARPYPLRLIMHNNGTATRLLQRAYVGAGLGSQPVVATKESLLLPAELARARRISTVHLPFSEGNTPWNFTGSMRQGFSLAVTVDVGYDDQASNPFLHTYHPDHDNLDATFASAQPEGTESYGIRRQITLNFTAPDPDFDSLTSGGSSFNGSYVEIITFLGKNHAATRQFDVRGSFVLNRISDIAALTQ